MAIYKCDQSLTKLAIPGRSMTPIDQNCSCNVVTIVLGLPSVMSETMQKNLKN